MKDGADLEYPQVTIPPLELQSNLAGSHYRAHSAHTRLFLHDKLATLNLRLPFLPGETFLLNTGSVILEHGEHWTEVQSHTFRNKYY